MLVICAIDNLAKGASGGALQAANVALGLPETAGLSSRSVCCTRERRPGQSTADVLVEALPYIRRFAGQVVVVKYGGNALAGASDDDALGLFAQDIVLMHQVGMRPVVVHGGGPQISDLMQRLGKVTEFRNGLRVTDAGTVGVVQMVLAGQVNPQLVAAINVHGPLAVGVSGGDAGLIRASARDPELGFVGDVEAVNPTILNGLIAEGLHPGGGHDRGRCDAARRTTSTPTPWPGRSPRRWAPRSWCTSPTSRACAGWSTTPTSIIRQTTCDELDALMADGTIAGGMIPKVESCVHAVRGGVRRAHILDGRIPHVLLLEIFTDEGIGTMVQ